MFSSSARIGIFKHDPSSNPPSGRGVILAGEQMEMRNSKPSFVVYQSIDKGQRVSGQMAGGPLL
jgi:hypothetical protein